MKNKLDKIISFWEKVRVDIYNAKEEEYDEYNHLQVHYDNVCLFLAHLKEIKDEYRRVLP